jgi:hypothetical protein
MAEGYVDEDGRIWRVDENGLEELAELPDGRAPSSLPHGGRDQLPDGDHGHHDD